MEVGNCPPTKIDVMICTAKFDSASRDFPDHHRQSFCGSELSANASCTTALLDHSPRCHDDAVHDKFGIFLVRHFLLAAVVLITLIQSFGRGAVKYLVWCGDRLLPTINM